MRTDSPRAATPDRAAPRSLVYEIAPASIVALAAVFALRRLDDFDTWWHLAAGRWIVEHGRVPATDTLSHTVPDHAWINLQWLYDVGLYALYRLGGTDLLVLASALCFTLSFWLVLRAARVSAGPLVASGVGLCAVLVAEERFMIRPEMASFVLLAAVLWLLLTARRDEGRRLWMLPVLTALWVNLHALFVVGLACIAGFAAGAALARSGLLPGEWRPGSDPGPAAAKRLWTYGALAAAASLLNPFFHRGALFPLELFSRINGSNAAFQVIGEFRSPFSGYFTTWSISAYQTYFFASALLMFAAAVAGLSRPRPRDGGVAPRFDVGAALVFCALAYLSTLARRNIGLFALGATPIVAAWIALLADRAGLVVTLERTGRAHAVARAATGAIVAASVVLAALVATNRYYSASGVTREFGLGTFESNFPARAAAFVEDARFPGKLYNDLTAGGYLTWHGGVEGGVYIDGRLEVYDEFFPRYSAALNDVGAWVRDADARDIQTVVLFHRWANRHNLIRYLARDPGWALAYFDETAIVFVRRRGNEEAIARAAAAFPAAETRTRERLAAAVPAWRDPIERSVALDSYARLLSTLGAADRALEAWEQLLALELLTPDAEAQVRFNVAWLLASRGERASARLHAEQAARLSPENPQVKQLLERLGT